MITLATLGGVISSFALGAAIGFIAGYYIARKYGNDPKAL